MAHPSVVQFAHEWLMKKYPKRFPKGWHDDIVMTDDLWEELSEALESGDATNPMFQTFFQTPGSNPIDVSLFSSL